MMELAGTSATWVCAYQATQQHIHDTDWL